MTSSRRPALIIVALAATLAGYPATARDWQRTLIDDATAFHAEQATNHPGPFNPRDPGFTKSLDAALAAALARAATVTTRSVSRSS